MKIENGQSLLFTGDSITDCGRARPIGAGTGLGNGYVAFVDSLLSVFYPQRRIRVLNSGIGGDRVINLEARWETDVLLLEPAWLAIMIGVNDVWRQFDNPLDPNQVALERYESVYRGMLDQARPKLQGLALMTPFYMELNRSDPMRERMDAYSEVVARLAHEFSCLQVLSNRRPVTSHSGQLGME